jgi:hypothetical protein
MQHHREAVKRTPRGKGVVIALLLLSAFMVLPIPAQASSI